MRIWSLHPKYLDAKGLVALWRETLLAKNVLENKTKGYRNHPQLLRFKATEKPVATINFYLSVIYEEANIRGYRFNKEKIGAFKEVEKIAVTSGQLNYEKEHLLRKLDQRDYAKYKQFKDLDLFEVHPLFYIVSGEIESWEKIS
ncbi:hypothetical protein C7377_1412 [Balneicella halophila]|uniref:Pyrimidine dimer DNA glycosylase /DNA-(Apurinic or apyrimidinic site) lyase n=1 Tax=Balneicella halophila TaxID=1537566 RepID=A0A7L4URY0_BALHA|nr:pyrimidine dimer DNA glycosylase/endonuclease V [Balneicella halophila]PVX51079.1 hypothetical protein C7377_1412 [Balneicella halophila]